MDHTDVDASEEHVENTDKYTKLLELLRGYGKMAVAFSGGADSALLLQAAFSELGEDALAVIISTAFISPSETTEAIKFCKERGISYKLIRFDIFAIDGMSDNPVNRCYLCKRAMMESVLQAAHEAGIQIAVDGTNADDIHKDRPGLKALSELGIQSPLVQLGFTKKEVRDTSHRIGLPTWNKPSESCLATHVPHNTHLSEDMLRRMNMTDRVQEERNADE